jgi:hypothetical protein
MVHPLHGASAASVACCMAHAFFAHNYQSMKRARAAECMVSDRVECISRACMEIIEQDPDGRIPLFLLLDLLPCSMHSRYLNNQSENQMRRNLGKIAQRNSWTGISLVDGHMKGVSFRQDVSMLFWSNSHAVCNDHIFQAIVSRKVLHEWIASVDFSVLLQDRFFLNQLLKKNGEYVELHDAFELLLQEHDQHGVFHLNSCTFFKKCLTLSSAGTFQVSVGDTPVFDPFSWPFVEIAAAGIEVECTKVKPYVARVQFPTKTLYVKLESISADSAILTCFRFLNQLFPQVRIGSLILNPRLFIYEICGTSEFSIKSAVEGVELIEWDGDIGVSSLDRFVVSIAASSIAVHLFGINDRHGRNIIINPRTSEYVNIDNKHCMGAKPIGLDSCGMGMVPSLWSFLEKNDRIELLRTVCSQLFAYIQIHEQEIIQVAKISFYTLRQPDFIAQFISSRIRDKQGLMQSLETSFYNVGKNVKQGGVKVALKELVSTLK